MMDDIIANSERNVPIFQPLDISSTGEPNLHNQNGLLEYQYPGLQDARNIRPLRHSGRSDSNDIKFQLGEDSLKRGEREIHCHIILLGPRDTNKVPANFV